MIDPARVLDDLGSLRAARMFNNPLLPGVVLIAGGVTALMTGRRGATR